MYLFACLRWALVPVPVPVPTSTSAWRWATHTCAAGSRGDRSASCRPPPPYALVGLRCATHPRLPDECIAVGESEAASLQPEFKLACDSGEGGQWACVRTEGEPMSEWKSLERKARADHTPAWSRSLEMVTTRCDHTCAQELTVVVIAEAVGVVEPMVRLQLNRADASQVRCRQGEQPRDHLTLAAFAVHVK